MAVLFILEDTCTLSQISWLHEAGSLCHLVAGFLKESNVYKLFVYRKTNKNKTTLAFVISGETTFNPFGSRVS